MNSKQTGFNLGYVLMAVMGVLVVAWLSRRHRAGRPSLNARLHGLILRMPTKTQLGARPGELRMLGIEVSERSVSRYLPRQRPTPGALGRWIKFLRNFLPESVAERRRRTLDRKRAPGVARSRRRLQRAPTPAIVTEFVAYYHDDRTHAALRKGTPAGRLPVGCHGAGAAILSRPRLGGFHHQYDWAA